LTTGNQEDDLGRVVIKIKRVYEPVSEDDGFRILVDRLWPRGVSKEKAHVDLWIKDIGPSDELRKWFAHDPNKWEQFKKRYAAEMKNKSDLIWKIKQLEEKKGTVTLVYSARDPEHNQAIALNPYLQKT